jgi:hypothetical protein
MTRERDPFRLPLAGLEIAPLAALLALPLPGRPASPPASRLLVESGLGALVVVGVYQALLSGLRCEALVRRGAMDRSTQLRTVMVSACLAMRDGAALGLVLSVLLLVLPWLAVPLGLVGALGLGRASIDVAHAFWDGLSPSQRRELHQAAFRAGVSLNRLLAGAASA